MCKCFTRRQRTSVIVRTNKKYVHIELKQKNYVGCSVNSIIEGWKCLWSLFSNGGIQSFTCRSFSCTFVLVFRVRFEKFNLATQIYIYIHVSSSWRRCTILCWHNLKNKRCFSNTVTYHLDQLIYVSPAYIFSRETLNKQIVMIKVKNVRLINHSV